MTSLLHPGLAPGDYRTSPLLRDVATWQARILSGNSLGPGRRKGGFDNVGYVMVPLEGEFRVIPVAVSDEHDQGMALLRERASEWGITPAQWFPVALQGGGIFLYGREDSERALAVLRRWHEAGGPEVLVRSTGQGGLPGRWRVDSLSFLAGRGTPQPGADGLLPVGQRFVDLLRAVRGCLASMRDPDQPDQLRPGDARGFRALRIAVARLTGFLHAYNEFSMPLAAKLLDGGWFGTREDIMDRWSGRLDTAVLERDAAAIERMLFTHDGLKNCIHMQIRGQIQQRSEFYGMGDIFGDLALADSLLGRMSPALGDDPGPAPSRTP